jgi:glyoxylase-like metal-dependent hydrolase (beta-lactamase superfamily II)
MGDFLMNRSQIHIETVVSAPFEENAYIAHLEGKSDALVVDPGLEPEAIITRLDTLRVQPAAILNTHGHGDHIGGNGALKKRWPEALLVIGQGDAPKLTDPRQNLSLAFGFSLNSPPADRTVREGDLLEVAGFRIRVLDIPGHSAGHVVYVCEEHEPLLVFVGDVIFSGSIGRTDFPDGDHGKLIDGILTKLFALPDDTILLSGHGPETTIGREKRFNPFVGRMRKAES